MQIQLSSVNNSLSLALKGPARNVKHSLRDTSYIRVQVLLSWVGRVFNIAEGDQSGRFSQYHPGFSSKYPDSLRLYLGFAKSRLLVGNE